MKITWASNAPWAHSGYGSQTAQVTRRLAADGHDVAIACNWGLQGSVQQWEGIRCYPAGWESYSNDAIPAWHAHHSAGEPSWLMTLFDVWVFKSPEFARNNVASWVPVDHLTAPPMVADWFNRVGAVPIAMSRFGERALKLAGIEKVHYAPHGIDCSTYRPRRPTPARVRCGLPTDAYIVGMVANNKGTNPPRKSFAEAFMAFGMFRAEHPDALLYVHSEMSGIAGGIDLQLLADACNIPPDALVFAPQAELLIGSPDSTMADLYSSFDVLLSPSRGEGFGIPVIEAQSCGTPVIVTDATAQPELCGAGWLVTGQPEWDPAQGSWWMSPSVESILDALRQSYAAQGDRDLSRQARDFAIDYDADTVFGNYWRPILADLEQMITPSADPIAAEPL